MSTVTGSVAAQEVPSTRVLRLGTRRSALALTQSGLVADRLRAAGQQVEVVEVTTEGDTNPAPLEQIGGTGVFASALRHALLEGRVDLAVHSLKDLPTAPEPGLLVAAVPQREDPRDVLVARDGLTLGELPTGAVIGTGSPRRVAQIAALGLGLEAVGVRGNVETRIAKVAAGEVDAVVLARAGLSRLGRLDDVTEVLDPLQVLPAPGQGALAVECRADDPALVTLLATLEDPDSRAATDAERSLLATLEAGCTAPVGALAEVVEGEDGPELSLRAFLGSADGSLELRRSATGPVAEATRVGADLARLLLEDAEDLAPGWSLANAPASASVPDRPPTGAPPDPHPAGAEGPPTGPDGPGGPDGPLRRPDSPRVTAASGDHPLTTTEHIQ